MHACSLDQEHRVKTVLVWDS